MFYIFALQESQQTNQRLASQAKVYIAIFCPTDASPSCTDLQQRLQLPQRGLHEVLLRLGEGPHTAGEQLLGGAIKLGQLVQQLGVERLVVAARHLQLILHAAVLEALGALLAVVIVQQLVEALLDELVRPGEHEQQLRQWVDDQGLRAFLLLSRRGKGR